MPGYGLGYRLELEDRPHLAATANPFVLRQTFTAPEKVCHRGWRKAKNQDGVGACTGFSRASGSEILNYIQTGGQVLTFSGMYAYLENQRECGLFGRDQGATIDGSVRAALKSGICREALFPFPGRYLTNIPRDAAQEGENHLIRSHAVMRSYDDCYQWLASGVGVILIGVPWTTGMTRVGRTLELSDLPGARLGGHAMVLEGYGGPYEKIVVDEEGRPYLDNENSHSAAYGDRGWTLVAPRVVTHWIEAGHTLIGISDLEEFAPRKIKTYQEWLG